MKVVFTLPGVLHPKGLFKNNFAFQLVSYVKMPEKYDVVSEQRLKSQLTIAFKLIRGVNQSA
jgi:hypothetical protein